MTRSAWLLPLLVACASGPEPVEVEGFEVHIVTPTAESTFGWSDPIPLDVEVTRGGAAITPDTVTWNIGAWTGTGDGIVAEGVPAGEHVVTAAVLVEGIPGTATAPIRIEAPPELSYSGPMVSTLELSDADRSGSAACEGSVRFQLRNGAEITGTGESECSYQILLVTERFDVSFTLEGILLQGTATGTLTTDYEGTPFTMAWTGTGTYGGRIGGAFDFSDAQGDGTMRLYGDFQADPL